MLVLIVICRQEQARAYLLCKGEMLQQQRQKLFLLFGKVFSQSCVNLLNFALKLPESCVTFLAVLPQCCSEKYSQLIEQSLLIFMLHRVGQGDIFDFGI